MDVMVDWFNFTYRFGSFWGWNNSFLAPVKKNTLAITMTLKAIIGVV